MSKKNNRKRKIGGFADTKQYPHKGHPAYYEYLSKEESRKYGFDSKKKSSIIYGTFTHHDTVKIDGKCQQTIPLDGNVNPNDRLNGTSYMYPRVYVGHRSSLGKEHNNYKFYNDVDMKTTKGLLGFLAKEKVTYTSNNDKTNKKTQ